MRQTATWGAALLLAGVPAIATAQSTFELGEIVVLPLALPTERERTGASIDTLDREALEAGGDVALFDQIARLPGVNIARQGGPGTNADIIIRGARSRYVGVYVDGILVTDPSVPTTQFEDIGGFTLGTVDRVEILKGSQSALFGASAVGGVVDVSTLGGEDLGPGTHQQATIEGGSYGTLGASYAFTRNTERASVSFSASSVRSDGFSASDENNGNTEADAFDRTRVAVGVTYGLTETLTLSANAFYETGSSEFDSFDSATFEPADGTFLGEVSEREAIGARVALDYEGAGYDNAFALTWYQTDRQSVSEFGTSRFRGDRLQATNVTSFDPTDAVEVSLGLDARLERSRTSSLPSDGETVTTLGAFAETVYSPTEGLDLIGTVRLDNNSAFGSFVTGRLALAYRPTTETTLRGAVATGYRAPSISELFDDSPFFVGNPDVEPETSVTAELGIDQTFANGASLSATAFWGQIDNFIRFVSLFPDPGTVENVPGASITQGIELSGSLPVNDRATLYGAATLIESRDANGDRLIRTPTADIALGGSYAFTDAVTGTANARYVAGVVDGGVELPSYTVVNVGAEYEINDRASVYLRVENVFDTEYQNNLGYGTSDRAFYVGVRARF